MDTADTADKFESSDDHERLGKAVPLPVPMNI
jgi:hypothetical protein